MNIDLKDLITQKEAAEIRGVTIQAINFLMRRGKLRTVEIAGKKFLLRSEVERYTPDPGGRPAKQGGPPSRATGLKGTQEASLTGFVDAHE